MDSCYYVIYVIPVDFKKKTVSLLVLFPEWSANLLQ